MTIHTYVESILCSFGVLFLVSDAFDHVDHIGHFGVGHCFNLMHLPSDGTCKGVHLFAVTEFFCSMVASTGSSPDKVAVVIY